MPPVGEEQAEGGGGEGGDTQTHAQTHTQTGGGGKEGEVGMQQQQQQQALPKRCVQFCVCYIYMIPLFQFYNESKNPIGKNNF